ncbi:hypothetical protein M501DRAFT_1020663 [Patellaria atrata CBS 101060]|uniref:C2H2-type domain-containing protein n=1 Tax=Patellaria atrata CBS 101060 TaxID=1346257 RepID=A0A9P4VKJ5_9PEZI|nr:hypothetical protein M501DRAFT_1020663 [Patellaria atrata CBS 101060]
MGSHMIRHLEKGTCASQVSLEKLNCSVAMWNRSGIVLKKRWIERLKTGFDQHGADNMKIKPYQCAECKKGYRFFSGLIQHSEDLTCGPASEAAMDGSLEMVWRDTTKILTNDPWDLQIFDRLRLSEPALKRYKSSVPRLIADELTL